MLKQLHQAGSTSFVIPRFIILPDAEIPKLRGEEFDAWAESILMDLVSLTQEIASDRVFVRAQPLDESENPALSFAGVYQSYTPRRGRQRGHHLTKGVARVLRDRFGDYSNYYYARHRISSGRAVDLMFSEMADDTSGFGTCYVHNNQCLLELFDSPLAIFLQDPLRIAANRETVLTGFRGRLVRAMFEVSEILRDSVDIEFLVSRSNQIIVYQARPISPRHRENWQSASAKTWETVIKCSPSSNVVNQVGSITGTAVDLRLRKPLVEDFESADKKIFVINHRQTFGGTATLEFLRFLTQYGVNELSLLIDHGAHRVNDHLQYISFEDPGISFLAHSAGVPHGLDQRRLLVESDGFTITLS
jgi:hypothetical protein